MNRYKKKDILGKPFHKLQRSQDNDYIKIKSFTKRKKRDWEVCKTHSSSKELHENNVGILKRTGNGKVIGWV